MLAIYKASAGSGKTFTLAYEYIKMLLGVKDPETGRYTLNRSLRDRHRHILAVTFTNKATDEMKGRIVHELARLARMEPRTNRQSDYLQRLCEELHCSADNLQVAAAAALRQLLFDFNFFQVSTIDSFFQIILRTFAREVDIAGNYEVDLDNDRAIGQGVRDLFDSLSVNSGSEETRRIVNWITQYLLGELAGGRQISLFNRQSQVHSRFLGFIKKLSNDDFAARYSEMSQYLADSENLREFVRQISEAEELQLELTRRAAANAIDIIRENGFDTDKKLKVSHHLLSQMQRVAVDGRFTGSARSMQKTASDISNAFGKPLREHLDRNPNPRLVEAIADACRQAVEGDAKLSLCKHIRSNLFILGLLDRVYYYVNRYRNDNNTIFLSDTNSLLREIIGDEKDHGTPFVYERVGIWINHFLIDEFQDTSRMQWENLNPLLHEGQDNGHDSLIIGDEKQCIYRFRFSDPTLLQNEVQREFGPMAERRGDNEAGNTNWRSSSDVVRFNNDLFDAIARDLGFEETYANVRQRVSPKHASHRGYVSLNGIEASKVEDFRAESMRIMTEEIIRQLRSGYRPADIAVLTRYRAEGAAVIAHLMEQSQVVDELRDIRIVSDDALFVDSAPAVRLIISVIRFLAMPQAEDSGANRSHRKGRLREIARMINRFEHLLSKGLNSAEALTSALEQMASATPDAVSGGGADPEEIVGSMACFNLPSLVERIIVRFISEEVAENQNMYISAFVDAVSEFCSRGSADLHSFLDWWSDTGHTSRVAAPLDEKAIRVMTIHKSKGLEFRCVHIPFINREMVEFSDLEWFDTSGLFPEMESKIVPPMLPLLPADYMESTPFAAQYRKRCREQLLDELNVMYVALTRAKDEMIVGYRLLKNIDESTDAAAVLQRALGSIEMMSESPENSEPPEIRRLYRGEPTVAETAEGSAAKTAIDPDSTFEMQPYLTADRDDLWESLDIESEPDYQKARGRGIVLHDVLARVARIDDLPSAILRCSYRGRLPREDAEEVSNYLASQLHKKNIRPWFEGYRRVLCERPLIGADNEELRPDRVVWTADGHVDVIDYKFGEERQKKYAAQVRSYMDALRRLGHDNVRGFIWYVDSGLIKTV